jgi:hypothetical protein
VVLKKFVQYAEEQGYISYRSKLDDLFAPVGRWQDSSRTDHEKGSRIREIEDFNTIAGFNVLGQRPGPLRSSQPDR